MGTKETERAGMGWRGGLECLESVGGRTESLGGRMGSGRREREEAGNKGKRLSKRRDRCFPNSLLKSTADRCKTHAQAEQTLNPKETADNIMRRKGGFDNRTRSLQPLLRSWKLEERCLIK